MERILVTGGSGFIGSYLVDRLVELGNRVTIFDLKPPIHGRFREATFIRGDLTSQPDVEKAVENQHIVFHLAGLLGTHELLEKVYDSVSVNIGGTVRLLDACRRQGAKVVLVSKPNCWLNPYTITKKAMENFLQMYRLEFGLQAIVVRWFNVYGGRQPLFEQAGYRKAIPTWIVSGLAGQEIEIYGNGEQTMDLVFTSDTVDATLSLLDYWDLCEGQTFEIGCGEEASINEVASLIQHMTGGKSPITYLPMRPGERENTRIKADISLIKKITGWCPRVSLEEGLQNTIAWYAQPESGN